MRGLSVGYEPWKSLVRHKVAQTPHFHRGKWPPHSNWILNDRNLVKHGSSMWQGIMKAWCSIQSGLEQQDPTTCNEIARQPLFGNRFLTNEQGLQWGTESKTNLKFWADKNIQTIKDMVREDGQGWRPFAEHVSLRRSSTSPHQYIKIIQSIPWPPIPIIPTTRGLWIAQKVLDGSINQVYHVSNAEPIETSVHTKLPSEQLTLSASNIPLPAGQYSEVRVIRCGGAKRQIFDFNPLEMDNPKLTVWLWGND